jgi:hypothetical protein
MNPRTILIFFVSLSIGATCVAQQKPKDKTITGNFCDAPTLPSPGPTYKDLKDQPKDTADLPSVVQTVEQALKCYQALSGEKDPLQPKGLPKLNSVEMDFKTTTGKTVGFTFSIFVFKVGASREKDVTDELKFTYSVPKKLALPKVVGLDQGKPKPVPLYEELVKEVQAAARAAQTQSKLLGMPLNKVSIAVSYGIKFDGNVSISVPVQLVTIGGNGDYNKNNTQSITLSFEEPGPGQ